MSVTNNALTIAQVKADLFAAKAVIAEAERLGSKKGKYYRGLAGYHLQQAAEKMIKIQIYQSGATYNNAKMYKHSLDELLNYASSIGVKLSVPEYVFEKRFIITKWEAEGRYDVHAVVRLDTLKRCYSEMDSWYAALKQRKFQ